MAPLLKLPGTLGIGDQPQMPQDPPQPRRVQPPRRLDQDGFGFGGDLGGQLLGAVGEHLGVGR